MKEPSEKQIKFANKLANIYGIDIKSIPFTAKDYWEFINKHYTSRRSAPIMYEGGATTVSEFYGVDCYDLGIYPWGDS